MKSPSARGWFVHSRDGARRLGIVEPGETPRFFDVGPDDSAARLDRGGLDAGELEALAQEATPMTATPEWAVPVARPSKILCLGKNFAAHAAEMGGAVPDEPMFFTKLGDSLCPADAPVVLPHWLDSRIDHEIELGVILGFPDPGGRGRKYVAREEALDLVAGWTVLNDVTARQIQKVDREAHKPWLRSKSFDTFCPIGPWVLPRTSLDIGDLEIRLAVDGAVRQQSRTSLMVVDVPRAIEWFSRHTTLRPGDILAMGTPEGVAPIEDGMEMLGEIEGIGELRSPVRREPRPTD